MIFLEKPCDFREDLKVVGCFVEVQGKILQLFRNKEKTEGEKWGCPAGKMHALETKEEAMVRELFEETGIQVPISEIQFLKTIFVRFPEVDICYSVFSLKLEEFPEVILHPEEHVLFEWVNPREALNLPLMQDEDTCIKMFYNL